MQVFGDVIFAEVKGSTNGKQNVAMVKFKEHTAVKVESKDSGYIKWGASDNWPKEIAKKVKKNGSAVSSLRVRETVHYGNGLVLFRNETSDEGKKKIISVDLSEESEIETFLKRIKYKLFLQETIMDLEWLNIAFPEFVLSVDRKSIVSVRRQRAAWCRFAKPENGIVKKIYISSKFGESATTDVEKNEFVSELSMLNPYLTKEEVLDYCIKNKIDRFTIPFGFPMFDESFYPEAKWHAVLESGWLEVANSVPEYKLNIFKNQVSIKYLIEIDERYFLKIYKDAWDDYSLEQKLDIRKKLIQSITDNLSSNKNSGKSISSIMFEGDKGEQVSAVKVTAIDDKFKDGSYLPEAEAANSEVLFALGVDPSIIGAGIPGGKLGAGSGSDKRVAFNIMQSQMKPSRDITLSILEFIQDYNGWNPTIKFGIENTVITTLDENPTSTQKGI